jgi:hypothetical protein
MQTIALLLPLLLLVTPAIAHGQQATITAPQGTTINNATISVFQPKLSGTLNFVSGQGNVSGTITFSNQDLCPNCKWDWQHAAAFSGIFSGHPISGKYIWQYAPGPQGFANDSSLSLMYNYHHKNVVVMGNLTVVNPAHMEWSSIGPYNEDRHDYVVDGDFRLATGLHLHQGDVIHLMRGGTALNILSPAIAHATNESCPPGMYPDQTLGVYHCHDAHGTHGLAPANMTNQWHRAW